MKHLFFLILSLVMVGTASAQVTTSSINGKVTDSNGEVLVGATVIAVPTSTAVTTFRVCVPEVPTRSPYRM